MSPSFTGGGFPTDDTITPSAFVHLDSSCKPVESGATTTACTTLEGSQKLKGSLQGRGGAYNIGRRRPLQRLPIPESLYLGSISTDTINAEAVKLGYEAPQIWKEGEEGEDFLRSPGHSPLSRFQSTTGRKESEQLRRRFSFTSSATVLSLGRNSKDSRGRNRSLSVAHARLHPSPPRLGEQPELGVAKKKVLKRKPIPQSLFAELASEGGEKQKWGSFSGLLSGNLSDEVGLEIEIGNKLGLFFPSTSVITRREENKVTDSSPTSCDNLDTEQEHGLAQARRSPSPPFEAQLQQQRLRRTTRSISASYDQGRRNRASIVANIAHTSAVEGHQLKSSTAEPSGFHSAEKEHLGSRLPSTSPNSICGNGAQGGNNHRRGRTRSGSAPIFASSSSSEAEQDYRRYSASSQEVQVLRRVSRKREGEMRSVYLAQPTSSPSTSTHSTQHRVTSFLSEDEGIEVLRTPDPSFEPDNMSSSLTSSTGSFRGFDTLRSWDGSLASRTRTSSETSMASLLVLQQHIQQRNHLRQFASTSADLQYPPDLVKRRSSELFENNRNDAEVAVGSKEEARAKVEKEGGEKKVLVREYGAMRLKGFSIEMDGVTDRCEQAHLDGGADSEREGGSPRATVGLRRMFSNPLLPTTVADGKGKEVDPLAMGSLRERRAKPPISIAVATSSGSEAKDPAPVLSAGVVPMPRMQSKAQLFSSSCIHSPPPCPPPAVPLPDLPLPKSAPLIQSSATTVGGLKRILLPKRSFVRSKSTRSARSTLRHCEHRTVRNTDRPRVKDKTPTTLRTTPQPTQQQRAVDNGGSPLNQTTLSSHPP